jgi:hypothetical protein
MSQFREQLREEVDAFRRVRDEVRVQAQLGRADLRDRLKELEKHWTKLEARLDGVRKDAKADAEDVREALRLLARELKEGIDHLRQRLSS